jgi:hypothetical protein
MNHLLKSWMGFVFSAGAIMTLAGCAAPAFMPSQYVVDPNRPYRLATVRTIMICPSFDRLDEESRSHLDPKCNPSAYLTGVIEKELTASGVKHGRVSFAFTPSFEGVQKALQNGASPDAGAIVIASAINHFPDNHVISCDLKVYSGRGDLLFEKRGICMNFHLDNSKAPGVAMGAYAGQDSLVAPRMAMQQILADPDFQKAIQ